MAWSGGTYPTWVFAEIWSVFASNPSHLWVLIQFDLDLHIYASNIVKCVAKLLKTTYPRVNDMAMVSCRLISILVILEIGIDLCQVKYQRHSRKRKYGTPKMDTKKQTLQSDAVFSGPKWHVRGVSLFSIQCVLDIAKTPTAAMLSIATWRDQGGLWKDCPVHPDGLGMSRVEGCSQPKNAIHMH